MQTHDFEVQIQPPEIIDVMVTWPGIMATMAPPEPKNKEAAIS